MITPQQKLGLMRQAKSDPGLAMITVLEMLRNENSMSIKDQMGLVKKELLDGIEGVVKKILSSDLGRIEAELPDKVVLSHIQKLKGEPGAPADENKIVRELTPKVIETVLSRIGKINDGETPVKYKDYFTPEEIDDLKEQILAVATPKKGVNYFTSSDIQDLINEITKAVEAKIEPASEKEDLVAGVDYPTYEQIQKLIVDSLSSKITGEAIVAMINSLPSKSTAQIDASKIKNLPRKMGKAHAAHGGGSTTSSGGTPTDLSSQIAPGNLSYICSFSPAYINIDGINCYNSTTLPNRFSYTGTTITTDRVPSGSIVAHP